MDNQTHLRELTFRGILLGALITLIFTASNVYLGLKVGMTFASSIPAAVISMAVLRMFKDSSILENNIVQTQASAAGCISSVIFVMPALIMVGYWNGFPFWQTFLICAAGGVLGVIFTIPLRHAMVVKSTLPYPEGVAAAVILQSAEKDREQGGKDSSQGVKLLLTGSVLSSLFALCTSGFKVLVDSVSLVGTVSGSVFTICTGYSFALLGAGLLIGIGGGISLLIGTVICWGIGIPMLTALTPNGSGLDPESFAQTLWSSKLRFAGAGCIAIGAIWTLLVMIRPIIKGLKESLEMAKEAKEGLLSGHDTDLGLKEMLICTLVAVVIIASVFSGFISQLQMPAVWAWSFVLLGTFLAVMIGFLLAAACGYMAGLVGSSSSPISGITIISVVIVSLSFLVLADKGKVFELEGGRIFVTAFTLFTATVVNAIASISNDNLQDLKTGQLVNASPKKQQIALIIGTCIGSAVIAPVLQLLYNSYGFPDAMPREGMDTSLVLNAPQATLMSSIAQGIFNHSLEWTYILIGILIGVFFIAINALIKVKTKNRMYVAPLAVGLGIYLPSSVNIIIIVGAVASYVIANRIKHRSGNSADAEQEQQAYHKRNNLLAAGLIVGESLMGVLLAIILTISISAGGSEAPLALDLDVNPWLIGSISFVAFTVSTLYVLKLILRKNV